MKAKQQIRCILALVLSFCMILGTMPAPASAAEEDSMSLGEFLEAVEKAADEEGNAVYDGQNVTVQWEPVSGCLNSGYHDGCLIWESEADWEAAAPETPQRSQKPNAQYQIFNSLKDVTIQNVNFEYIPKGFTVCKTQWGNGTATVEDTRNGELQFLNTGSVTLENCSFEKVIASPFGPGNTPDKNNRSFTVTGCIFRNVYNAYALKDIYPASVTITGCTFDNCSGAIYFEGSVERSAVHITNNRFIQIDQYAASGKENTRGVIQISSACRFTADTAFTVSGNAISGSLVNDGSNGGKLPVIRQLADLGDVRIDGWTPGDPFSIINYDAESITLPGMPGSAYCTFMGWAEAADYNGPADLTNAGRFHKQGDTVGKGTYYAVWEIQGFTVTVIDSRAAYGLTGAGVYQPGDRVVINAGDPEGYVFTGWTTESPIALADAEEPVTSFIMPAANVTVIANWSGSSDGRKQDPFLKINKLWEGDSETDRPESVQINIYHEEELYKTVTIYEKYDWMGGVYIPAKWENDYWWVEETGLPEGYGSAFEEVRHLVFDVTNTWDP